MADYANYVGHALSLLGFALLGFIKGNDPWRLSTLLVGISLVALASLSFGMFTDMNGLFDLLAQENKIDEATHVQAKTVGGVWVFVLPAVIGAIGANLITAWFLAKKPS
jgi:uncharacterized membrane protein